MFQIVSRRNVQRILGISALSLFLAACGSDDSAPASPLRTGVFLDSAVAGLGYETATMRGKTNAAGEFNFNAGESITFSLGGFVLPTIQAANIVTPMDIFGSDSTSDPRVADLSRLLQSLDEDGDVNNGITLPLTTESITSDTELAFGDAAFEAQALAIVASVAGDQVALVDTEAATMHLNQTLVDNQLVTDDCTSDHPYVGRSAEFSNFAHGIAGTVTILNDCEMEVTGFNYDGGGPSVYFFAATDRAYSGDSFIIGNQLNGQRWANDTIRLQIPEGRSLDDFNSLSVWCADFNANFGDVFFGDV